MRTEREIAEDIQGSVPGGQRLTEEALAVVTYKIWVAEKQAECYRSAAERLAVVEAAYAKECEEHRRLAARVGELEEQYSQALTELMRAKDRYQRDVEGLNNEGDPIGGDKPWGMRHKAEVYDRLGLTPDTVKGEALPSQFHTPLREFTDPPPVVPEGYVAVAEGSSDDACDGCAFNTNTMICGHPCSAEGSPNCFLNQCIFKKISP